MISLKDKQQKLLNTFDVVFLSSNKWEISFKKGFLRIKIYVAGSESVLCEEGSQASIQNST